MQANPFTIGNPVVPEQFVGRSALLASAFDQTINRSNLALWGGPGMGKSSFLKMLTSPQVWQLQGHDPDEAVIVLLSCFEIEPFVAADFWHQVLKRIQQQTDRIPAIQTEIDRALHRGTPTAKELLPILRQLGQQDRFLVLLIDDYDVALRSHPQYSNIDIEAFLSDCRTLAYFADEGQYLSLVVTSSRRLTELGPSLTPERSPWYNHYLFRPLKPFTEAEVDALFAGMPITPTLKAGIRDIADGNPALLQNAGYLLYEALRTGDIPDPASFVQDFQTATVHYFQAIWQLSHPDEQTLFMLIALSRLKGRLPRKSYDLSGIDTIFSQKEIELNALISRGVIRAVSQADAETTYAFTSSIMEWWAIKQIQNSDETELKARQKGFLNLMSHRQASKLTAAIHWLWQHKGEVPSLLEWLGNVTAAFPKGIL